MQQQLKKGDCGLTADSDSLL